MASTVWKGQLTFGLVSFPVRLYTAARRERLKMHYVKRTPAYVPPEEEEPEEASAPEPMREGAASGPEPVVRVHQEFTTNGEQPVPRQELLRSYEVEPRQYVTFQHEELRKLRVETSPEMQILRSVRLAEIDPVYFDTSYYVVPDRGGEKPYALLFTALQETEYVALAKVAMHGREHVIVLRPAQKGLLAHTMFYSNEIRAANEVPADITQVAPKELTLAKTFVEAIAGPFAPEEFKDAYQEQIQNLIASKVQKQEIATSAAATPSAPAPVVNILDALKKSLDLAKKTAKPAGKVTSIKGKAQKRKA